MFRTTTLAITLAIPLALMGVNAPHAAAADAGAASAVLGAWSVDTARLPMPAGARPRSVTITFSEAGAGLLRTKVDVIDPSGARLQAEGVTPLDGSPTPVKSNFEADVSATTMPRPEVLVMQLAKGGVPASTRIYTVSAAGDTMVEIVAYFAADGQPVLRRNYFSRIR